MHTYTHTGTHMHTYTHIHLGTHMHTYTWVCYVLSACTISPNYYYVLSLYTQVLAGLLLLTHTGAHTHTHIPERTHSYMYIDHILSDLDGKSDILIVHIDPHVHIHIPVACPGFEAGRC
jgi:hypothetical protein